MTAGSITYDPQFLISIKDFAYDEDNALHYGTIDYQDYTNTNDETIYDYRNKDNDDDNFNDDNELNDYSIRKSIINVPSNKYLFEDGPPWQEDDDQNRYNSTPSNDEIHGKAIALFNFEPENDNEVALKEGQIIWISYRHGQGWLVAEDSLTGETGLVPEEYVQLISDYEDGEEPKKFLPGLMGHEQAHDDEDDWVDEEEEEEEELPNVGGLKLK